MTSPARPSLRAAAGGSAAAFHCRRRLHPAGGPGDQVFPPAFAGAVYAIEQRRMPGRDSPVTCVLLDSVQSQANRMEQALQEAVDAGRITLPLVVVDFSDCDPTGDLDADEKAGRLLDRAGRITSLQVPHRLAGATLRYSELNGVPFRKSERGKAIDSVSLADTTARLVEVEGVPDRKLSRAAQKRLKEECGGEPPPQRRPQAPFCQGYVAAPGEQSRA